MPGNDRLTETIMSLAESLSQAARESAANSRYVGKIGQAIGDVNKIREAGTDAV